MEEAVGDLILTPFRDIVTQANVAISNAKDGGDEQMLKAAQSLIKEGERALKRIEPLCRKHFDESGSHFVNAVKDNEEIAQLSEVLTNVLYDFEDYVEADGFDAEKFAELQALSRKAAPRIVHIITRMKLEASRPELDTRADPLISATSLQQEPQNIGQTSALQTNIATPVETTNQEAPLVQPGSTTGHVATCREGTVVSDTVGGADGASDPLGIMGFQSGPDSGLQGSSIQRHRDSTASTSRMSPLPLIEETPPLEPSEDAWDQATRIPSDILKSDEEHAVTEQDRRDPISASPAAQSPSPSPVQGPNILRPRRLDEGVAFLEEQERQARLDETNAIRADGRRLPPTAPGVTASNVVPKGSTMVSTNTLFLDEQGHPDAANPWASEPGQLVSGAAGPSPSADPRSSVASSGNGSIHSTVLDRRERNSYQDGVSPIGNDHRSSTFSILPTSPTGGLVSASFAAGPSTDPNSSQPPNSLQGLASSHQAGLEAVHPIQEIPDGLILVEDGLIPVESDTTSSRGGSDGTARKVDCSITLSSSFYQFKGFCEGAKEVIRGGPGVKKIKKQGLSIGAVEVAKCKCCPYELDWRQVERDVNGEDSGNYRSSGIGFRLRFLSKSHIPAKHIEDQIYGCLFCIQLGRTVEESDATVFFSQKQLFAHIARHPRPLPAIPGLTVIEGPEMPVRSRNNYDLWFTNPPVASQMTHIAREISVHPTATAAETYRQTPIRGIRRPPDGHRVLQFAVGAKIVGIEFPPRYNGEWCTGWADNEWAVFPAETVRLEPPPKSQIRMQGASNMKAVARWKWSYKGKDQGHWLKFDKGDTITGIGWTYSEHWCWSGTNSKGQWGIFPQSHIEPNTLSETPVKSDRASISSSEKRRSSLFPRISIRGRSDSASGSSSSHDAAVASSPRPSIF